MALVQPAAAPATPTGLERYRQLEKLGEGTYGIVFKAKDLITNRIVALKKIRLDMDEEGVPRTTIREVAVLRELRHPNVVRLIDVIHSPNKLTLVFEYLDQDLKKRMESLATRGPVDPMLVKYYTYQLLKGIAFCHGHRIIHRDLKPQNLLVNSAGQLKLADFGLARAFGIPIPPKYTHDVVTLWYRAPEVLLGSKAYSTPLDMWSVGLIFGEMARGGYPLCPGDSEIDQLFKIFHVFGTPTEEVWPHVTKLPDWKTTLPNFRPKPLEEIVPQLDAQGIDLLRQLCQYDPARRISAKSALNHPYFADLPNKDQ
ncbi:putative Cyclin-dependent kinase 3 [Paratrimastix pyriformis]|uniref:cyclin-dependent kinase n=1 Tax=Paratrimastix pyriformis TaxID=342808 RepID=A0ABQ8UHM5_9EUKA|nr:putative Cyclin-dependent kinase 3 [Paratrimastix pyriformis]|eukprot:GAFH01001854.1.p2 GENE.GAFH01001854.1~~GAFH01001854.1.p2  ORF type:complete len:313 (+),score=86.37 GAFH01001854.1:59-997(+)